MNRTAKLIGLFSREYFRRIILPVTLATVLFWYGSTQEKEGQKLHVKLPSLYTTPEEYINEFLNKTYLRRTIDSFQGGGGENSSVLFTNPSIQKFVIESKKRGIYVEDVHNKSVDGISYATFCASDSRAPDYVKTWGIPRIDCDQLATEKGWIGVGQFSSRNSWFLVRGKKKKKARNYIKRL